MRHYRYGTQDSQAIASDGLRVPDDGLPSTTTAFDDNAPGDTLTGVQFEDRTTIPSLQARSRIIATCYDDNAGVIFNEYRFTCRVATTTQSGGEADREAHAEVWSSDGVTWTQIRVHPLVQDDTYREFSGDVPSWTKRVGVVVDSNIVANNTGSPPNFQSASGIVTDFRLGESCLPPPVPTLAGQILLVNNQPTHRLTGA